MKLLVVFLTLCLVLASFNVFAAERPINPRCLVKAICSSSAPPVYATKDGGKTCQKFGNTCFYDDVWCKNDSDGLPELTRIPKENCGSIVE